MGQLVGGLFMRTTERRYPGRLLHGLFACAALTLVVVACGGDGSGNGSEAAALSAAEFRKQADAICSDTIGQVEALGEQPTTSEGFLDYSKEALPILSEGHRRLRQLVPPGELKETWDRGLALNDQIDQDFQDIQDALEQGDLSKASQIASDIQAKDAETGRVAREVGLTECG
jgi:hypothetical protein